MFLTIEAQMVPSKLHHLLEQGTCLHKESDEDRFGQSDNHKAKNSKKNAGIITETKKKNFVVK